MKKSVVLILTLSILGLFLLSGCIIKTGKIGGERDEHGCLVSAGYSWNEEVGACMRTWELDDNQRRAAGIAVVSLDYNVTVVNVQELECAGCFLVKLQRNDNQEMQTRVLVNWKVSENGNIEAKAAEFCDDKDVSYVYVCGSNIKVVTSLIGGGAKYYKSDGTSFRCPVVAPDAMSEECREVLFEKNCRIICSMVGCKDDAKVCPDGTVLSRDPDNDCKFPECPELEKTFCKPEQRNAQACTMEYRPVCGWNGPEIQCIKYPCADTYDNPCMACSDEKVEYWTEGECPE